MEHTYRVTEREGLRTIGIAFVLAGLLFVAVGVGIGVVGPIVQNVAIDAGRVAAALMATAIGTAAAWIGWDHLFRRPWLLQTGADGAITVQGAFWTRRLHASRIVSLELNRRKVGVEEEDARMLKITHTRGTLAVSWFPEIENLVADIRTLNPRVWVTGP